jgi:hypothetical protein
MSGSDGDRHTSICGTADSRNSFTCSSGPSRPDQPIQQQLSSASLLHRTQMTACRNAVPRTAYGILGT